MTDIVDIRKANDPRDVVHRVVRLLSEGHLVGLPTESGYVAAAHLLQEQAIQRLVETGLKSPPVINLRGEHELIDYLPDLGSLGQKLARRCWPGPIVLQLPAKSQEGLLQALPSRTRDVLVANDEAQFQWSANDLLFDVLKLLPAPIVTVAGDSDEDTVANTVDRFANRIVEQVELCIDSGPTRFDQPATVLRVSGEEWQVIRAGVVGEQTISRLTRRIVVFVCTGNTCRSPMAEGLFRKSLAERLKCGVDEVDDRGCVVISAGLAASAGMPASPESVALLRDQGIDITSHASRPMTSQIVRQSDMIYTMTRGHRDAILASHPEAAEKVQLLARDGSDVSDPIGMGPAEYETCRDEIEKHVRAIVDTMTLPQ